MLSIGDTLVGQLEPRLRWARMSQGTLHRGHPGGVAGDKAGYGLWVPKSFHVEGALVGTEAGMDCGSGVFHVVGVGWQEPKLA